MDHIDATILSGVSRFHVQLSESALAQIFEEILIKRQNSCESNSAAQLWYRLVILFSLQMPMGFKKIQLN